VIQNQFSRSLSMPATSHGMSGANTSGMPSIQSSSALHTMGAPGSNSNSSQGGRYRPNLDMAVTNKRNLKFIPVLGFEDGISKTIHSLLFLQLFLKVYYSVSIYPNILKCSNLLISMWSYLWRGSFLNHNNISTLSPRMANTVCKLALLLT
jgi:hypothetical protein